MPLDPQSVELLRRLQEQPGPDEPSVAAARELEQWRFDQFAGAPAPVASVRDVALPGPDGGELPARAYAPGAASGTLVWFHGGGWIVGSVALADDQARTIARASGCVVLSVDYRLSPEHRHPAALDDCAAAAAWAAGHLGELGGAGGGLALGGESAGANLAAAVTLLARERGGVPRIDFQLLAYPVLARVLATESRRAFADGHRLTADGLDWCWTQYLGGLDDVRDPLVAPLHAESHADLPPACILTAEYDPLRDEGELYGDLLRAAGVPAEVRRYEGMLHGFLGCAGLIDRAREALADAGRAVRAGLVGG